VGVSIDVKVWVRGGCWWVFRRVVFRGSVYLELRYAFIGRTEFVSRRWVGGF
jgi:hypothetical protein